MIETFKWYVFVFFARIQTKKQIKKLEQEIQDYSWNIGLEKNDSEELKKMYEEAKLCLYIKELTLKGLVYK